MSFNRQQSEDTQNRIRAAYGSLEQAGELPEQITARARAIARLAKVSQQTLYKYQSLWHPHHVQGEINETTRVSAAEIEENQSQSESLKVLENKGLHPLKEIIKGWAQRADDSGLDLESFSPDRGVRGMS